MFTQNIVDEQLKNKMDAHFIPLGQEVYSFDTEIEYYTDIQKSKFGITTKRSGWDCMRHYEFAANGAVLCFKSLDKKPVLSAPHGLNESNCIIYQQYEDLKEKTSNLSHVAYEQLLANSYAWVKSNTTTAVATAMLNEIS